MGAVLYAPNVMGTKGPRKMTVVVPKPGATANTTGAAGTDLMGDKAVASLAARYKAQQVDDCVILRNKPPRWNDALKAYCLNFGGRVTHASVKNFQLVSMDNVVSECCCCCRFGECLAL